MDNLFAIQTVFMSNEEPDIRVIEISSDADIEDRLCLLFGDVNEVVQFVVKNPTESSDSCPFFRIFIENYGNHTALVNYKFAKFLTTTGLRTLSSRCGAVWILGVSSQVELGKYEHIPRVFRYRDIPGLVKAFEPECLHDFPDFFGKGVSTLPESVQWNIFTYLESPEARILKDEFKRLTTYWDNHFFYVIDAWTSERHI